MSSTQQNETAPNVRQAALKFLERAVSETVEDDSRLEEMSSQLGEQDRALFHELTQGTLREWRYLEAVVAKKAKKPPKGRLLNVALLSAYQALFLDRVPEYALQAEAKALGAAIGASEPELRFLHWLLKTLIEDKSALQGDREKVLSAARQGDSGETPFELSVLNATPGLLDALTVVEIPGQKKAGRKRAIRALAAMKSRSRLIGYSLPGTKPLAKYSSAESSIAPDALNFEASPEFFSDLHEGRIRVQGEASQLVSRFAAETIFKAAKTKGRELRVLEMTAGRGGKLLGTLTELSKLSGGHEFPPIEWVAVDSSSSQIELLESDAAPLVAKYWPKVRLKAYCSNWDENPFDGGEFDFVWLDAPCTGFGTLSKLPQIAIVRGGENAYENAKKMSAIQEKLALAGCRILGDRGQFFYTVCTMTWPETWGLLELLRSRETLGALASVIQTYSLWPGSPPAPGAEGFFAAMIEK